MKKANIIPCTLAIAVIAAISATTAMAAKDTAKLRNAQGPQAPATANESFHRFIVKYRAGAAENTNAAAVARGANKALASSRTTVRGAAVGAQSMRKLATGQQLLRTTAKLDAAQAEAFMRQMKLDPNVVDVRIDRKKYLTDVRPNSRMVAPAYIPNDPMFDEYQWHFDAPDGGPSFDGGPNYGGANVSAAWDLADGDGVTIAVLDTGITEHPDINSDLGDAGYDFISDAVTSGRATDARAPGGWDLGDWTIGYPGAEGCSQRYSSWHGTHTAGTAGAQRTDNGIGMSGVAYNAQVLPLRVLGHCGGYTSDIVDAIVWAAGGEVDGLPDNENPAKVINLSLGGSGACEQVEIDAINEARDLGASVVVSAGNSNANTSGFSPGNCPGVITVASNGITSRRAYYSNYGAGIEISAPGGGVYANDGSGGTQIYDGFVWQAINPGDTTPIPADDIEPDGSNGGYGGNAGTSMSAPHVAGVIALMHSARAEADLPPLTPDEVLEILQDTATPFNVAPSASQPIGPGIVNAAAAVAAAIEPPCEVDCEPDATPIVNQVPVTGLSGSAGSETLYSIEVPEGVTGPLNILTYGGSGNVSVYVSFDEEPTTEEYDARSVRPGNNETIRINSVQAGTYYIKLVGERAYSNVTLQARHAQPPVVEPPVGSELENGVPVTVSGAAQSEQFWTMEVPAGTASVTFTLTPATSGDPDLYVRFGSAPTTTTYDCRPYLGSTSTETCTIANPQAGTFHVMVRGFSTFTGATLTGSYPAGTTGGRSRGK